MTTVRRTNRWRGVVAVSLLAAAIGVLAKRPLLLLGAGVGVAVATYPRLVSAPEVAVSIERRVDDDAPAPDDEVEVTTTVRNDGERTLWDLRIVDGIPAALRLVDGSARHAAVLRPGASTTYSYTLRATHGAHRFERATVVVRDLAGAIEVETTAATETVIECRGAGSDPPLRRQTEPLPGAITTDVGGSGVEFRGVRAYRPGDPIRRIDWSQFARSGELVTVEFHEERAASLVVCVDARPAAYCGREDDRHAVSYGVEAAGRLLRATMGTRDRIGVAGIGRDVAWHAPGTGATHVERAERLLETHPAFAHTPPEDEVDADAALEALRARLGRDDQVLLLSPLVDRFPAAAATTLEAAGHAVTIVSPDVTAAGTIGERLIGVERRNRIAALRNRGVTVIDWAPDDPLEETVARTRARAAP